MSFINFNNRSDSQGARYTKAVVKEALLKIETKNEKKVDSLLEGLAEKITLNEALELFSQKLLAMSALDEARLKTLGEVNESAEETLADEVNGELFTAWFDGTVSVTATTTNKTWDDGVPVLKELARGRSKTINLKIKGEFSVVHDVAHGWFYFTDGNTWYGLHQDDGYTDIIDLPFNTQYSESEAVDVNEARSIKKIQTEFDAVVADMATTVASWKSAEGDSKTQLLDKLKSLTQKRNDLTKELDLAIMGKDRNVELAGALESVVNEGTMSEIHMLAKEAKDVADFIKKFFKEFGDKVNKTKDTEEWVASLYTDMVGESISLHKNFDNAEDVKGSVYELEVNEDWGSSDQAAMNKSIHRDAGSPKTMPSPFDKKLRAAAEDAVDFYWDDWEEYQDDRDALIDNAVRSYLRSYFKDQFALLVRMFEGNEINENYEVIFSDGISQMKKFRSEAQALDFMKKEIASNKKLRDIAVYKPGMYSTTQTELVVAFWGNGSYLDNVSKKDPKLAAKKLEESVVTEAKFVKDFNRDVLKAKTKEEVLELYPNAEFFIGKSDHFFGELDDNLFFKAYYTKAQEEFEIKSVYSEKGSNYVHLYNESVVTEAKNTIGLAFKDEDDYTGFVEFIKDEKGSIKKDFGWDSKTKSWEVIMDIEVLDSIYGEGTPGNKESGWYGGLPGDFESVIIESVVTEDNERLFEATVEMDAMDPDNKDFLKFLKKNRVKIIDKKMEGPTGSQPVITMQGKRKDLETVLADEELGWADPDLAEYIEESVVTKAPLSWETLIERVNRPINENLRSKVKTYIKRNEDELNALADSDNWDVIYDKMRSEFDIEEGSEEDKDLIDTFKFTF